MDLTANPLAILAAAAAMFVVGGLWYGLIFARAWQRAAGVTDEQLSAGAVRVFGGSLVLALVVATSLSFFIGEASVGEGAMAGALAGATFFAAGLGMVYLFERRSLALFAINGGYGVVAMTVMGVIVGALQQLPRHEAVLGIHRPFTDDPREETTLLVDYSRLRSGMCRTGPRQKQPAGWLNADHRW